MKLLETSYLVDYERGRDSARSYFEDHADEPLTASTISMFELAFGVVWDGNRALSELRDSLSWVEFVEFGVEDALEGARILSERQVDGGRIPIPDAMIAGAARSRGATLVAAAAHFETIDGLTVDRHRS